MTKLEYYPQVFDRPTIEEARGIILTPEAGLTTDQRWEAETDWIVNRLDLPPHGLVVDYGCGVGRLSQAINCRVLGVDISRVMRAMAEHEVSRDDFAAISPEALSVLADNGLRAQAALAVWVLQHVYEPKHDIRRLADVLAPGARLFVVNRAERLVPSSTGESFLWANDGVSIYNLLGRYFKIELTIPMPESLCAEGAHFSVWVRRGI